MKAKFKIRDLIASPFMFLSQRLEYIAVSIGGLWTLQTIMDAKADTVIQFTELMKKKFNIK